MPMICDWEKGYVCTANGRLPGKLKWGDWKRKRWIADWDAVD